jgi:type 1 glutamine amidotransferase
MKRRDLLVAAGAAVLGLSAFPMQWVAAEEKKKKKPKILYFTKSVGFVHDAVKRDGKPLAFSEKILTELGEKNDFEVVCSQDAAVFDGDLDKFDLLAFYTTGEPLNEKQKKKLLDAVEAGKPFVGIHAATDTFRTKEGAKEPDPYIAMIGGQFKDHGEQQKAKMKVVSPKFPGMKAMSDGFEMHEEWYACYRFSKDMEVILLQETKGMKGDMYQRADFPATWAKMHGKGRVFYTSMGHREDVWNNKTFQDVLLGGIAWGLGNAKHEVKPNFEKVAPKAND